MAHDHDMLAGQQVLDPDGVIVGSVTSLLIDPVTRRGEWLLIELADESGQRLLPLSAASTDGAGSVQVPWDQATIAGSPEQSRDTPIVSVEAAHQVLEHFAMGAP